MHGSVLYCRTHDNRIRSCEDERLDQLFERRCDRLLEKYNGTHPAVVAGNVVFTYAALDKRANQVARSLRESGVRAGDRVGVMLKQSVDTYAALLAVLKLRAAYVPLDAAFPAERIAFIAEDADVDLIISTSSNRDRLKTLPLSLFFLDELVDLIRAQDSHRFDGIRKRRAEGAALLHHIYVGLDREA